MMSKKAPRQLTGIATNLVCPSPSQVEARWGFSPEPLISVTYSA